MPAASATRWNGPGSGTPAGSLPSRAVPGPETTSCGWNRRPAGQPGLRDPGRAVSRPAALLLSRPATSAFCWHRGMGDELIEDRNEAAQLVEVRGGQPVQRLLAGLGQPDPGDAAVVAVGPAVNQPGRRGAVDELDRAVRPQHEVAGQVADGRALLAAVALDREQKLMLGRGQADRAGLCLRPVLEPAQADPEGQQVLVVLLAE